MPRKRRNLTGQRFGRLLVIQLAGKDGRQGLRWLCRCECGTEVTVPRNKLVSGHTASCGCLRRSNPGRPPKTEQPVQEAVGRPEPVPVSPPAPPPGERHEVTEF